ncbi:DUF3592 domain-containing protein [Roseibacillus persicicus]|uniref:DUF3592 domain-containing protein n=1 Tax=Roseibacillus persicicus TaxID=454148 RepID=A0A918TT96_9BACT|nr:DUF3592 domain-containing protein [Roseibacillus persicicus]GHC55633.1 hypothetical protein GCM10007100_22880 [Roseibacillus persicicus]
MNPPSGKQPANNKKKTPGCFGWGWCAFSSIFVLAGLWMTFQELRLWTYEEVPCQVQKFEILDEASNDEPFSARVQFTYQHNGQQYTGNRLTANEGRHEDYEHYVELEQEVRARGTCFLNPDQPSESILQRSRGAVWGGIAFTLFGSFFVAIGVFIIKASKDESKALSAKGSSKEFKHRGTIAAAFFGIFALAGVGVFFGSTLPMARKALSLRSWEPTPATVIWSRVRSHDSDDGTTYSPDIFYRYRYQDQEHRSNTFSLSSGSSSGRSSKQKIVDQYPRGKEFTCYVNPKKPWQAVGQPKLGWSVLIMLLPLPFLAVGFGGVWWSLKKSRELKSPALPERKGHLPARSQPGKGNQKLKSSNRSMNFFGHLIFALFWCGIVSVFVVVAWGKWASGHPEWFLNIFLIPFILVGLIALLSLPYSFLAIFSPRFDLSVKDEDLRPGIATKFRWKQTGGSGQLTEMTITLVGQEEATYQRGTDRSTATSIFYQKDLFTTTSLPSMLQSECDLIFPHDALPTLKGEHNRIRWYIRMHAAVKSRPDVRERIDLILNPLTESDFR